MRLSFFFSFTFLTAVLTSSITIAQTPIDSITTTTVVGTASTETFDNAGTPVTVTFDGNETHLASATIGGTTFVPTNTLAPTVTVEDPFTATPVVNYTRVNGAAGNFDALTGTVGNIYEDFVEAGRLDNGLESLTAMNGVTNLEYALGTPVVIADAAAQIGRAHV